MPKIVENQRAFRKARLVSLSLQGIGNVLCPHQEEQQGIPPEPRDGRPRGSQCHTLFGSLGELDGADPAGRKTTIQEMDGRCLKPSSIRIPAPSGQERADSNESKKPGIISLFPKHFLHVPHLLLQLLCVATSLKIGISDSSANFLLHLPSGFMGGALYFICCA